MFASLVALIALSTQQANDLQLITETLNQAIPHIFPDKAYTVEYATDIADAPVAYSLSKRTDPKTDLKNFCSALFLETEFNETKKTIRIKKSQFLLRNNRRAEIAKSLDSLRTEVAPLIRLDPKKLHLQKMNLLKVLSSEASASEKLAARTQASLIDTLLTTTDVALILSLIGNSDMAKILSAPCSKFNYGGIPPDAAIHVNQYLAGTGMMKWDYYGPGDTDAQNLGSIKNLSNDKRSEALKLAENAPIPYLRHENWQNETQVGLYFVTPDSLALGASISLSVGKMEQGTTTNIPALSTKEPIKVQPLWNSERVTLNGLCTMANDFNVNFASWLSSQKMWAPEGQSFESLQKQNPGLSAKTDRGWLTVFNLNEPMALSSKAWKTFFKLKGIYDSKPVRRSELLAALSALSDTEISSLEQLGVQFSPLPRKYQVLTSGITLFRAYLTCLEAQPKNSLDQKFSFNQLPEGAKKDFLAFFSSEYVWNQYPQLFHPANQPRFQSASLNISYDPMTEGESHNSVHVTFTSKWNPTVNGSPIIFPVATKNMVP